MHAEYEETKPWKAPFMNLSDCESNNNACFVLNEEYNIQVYGKVWEGKKTCEISIYPTGFFLYLYGVIVCVLNLVQCIYETLVMAFERVFFPHFVVFYTFSLKQISRFGTNAEFVFRWHTTNIWTTLAFFYQRVTFFMPWKLFSLKTFFSQSDYFNFLGCISTQKKAKIQLNWNFFHLFFFKHQ